MIRSLTSGTLSGWQEGKDEATDLPQLAASFRIERGQATTGDLMLAGPLVRMTGAGTVNIVTKSLALRVEPKLVMTIQGQGGAADPVGLGIPVVVQGPWRAPSIYPDMAGILDNPEATYAKLREMGKGLFGAAGGGSPAACRRSARRRAPERPSDQLGGKLGETLGALIQQGLGASRSPGGPAARPAERPGAAGSAAGGRRGPDQPSPMDDVLKQLFGR